MRRGLARGLVAVAGLVVAVAAVEVGLRALYPRLSILTRHERLGTSVRPHLDGRATFGGHERIVRITTNALGLRGPELGARPAGARRVLALGDSFTFGHAVEAAEAWPAILESELTARGRGAWEVINAGVSGHGTGQQLLMYEALAPRVEPEVVVLGFAVVNDVLDNLCVEAERYGAKADAPCFSLDGDRLTVRPPQPPAASPSPAWWPRSRAVDLLMGQARRATMWNPRILTLARSLGLGVRDTRLLPDTVTSWYDPRFAEVGWPLTRRLLEELRERLRPGGTSLVILAIPSAIQIDARLQQVLAVLAEDQPSIRAFLADPHRPQRILADFCNAGELTCVDPLPALLAAARRGEPSYYPIDGHWTPSAHRTAAELVAARLDRARP
jgi:hypothetical protein